MTVKEQYGCGWEHNEKNYLEHKVDVMAEFGLTDSNALREYLEAKTANAVTEQKREIQLDNICRDLLNDYYNGDRTFVKKYKG